MVMVVCRRPSITFSFMTDSKQVNTCLSFFLSI